MPHHHPTHQPKAQNMAIHKRILRAIPDVLIFRLYKYTFEGRYGKEWAKEWH
jgi:hypothetical protein